MPKFVKIILLFWKFKQIIRSGKLLFNDLTVSLDILLFTNKTHWKFCFGSQYGLSIGPIWHWIIFIDFQHSNQHQSNQCTTSTTNLVCIRDSLQLLLHLFKIEHSQYIQSWEQSFMASDEVLNDDWGYSYCCIFIFLYSSEMYRAN